MTMLPNGNVMSCGGTESDGADRINWRSCRIVDITTNTSIATNTGPITASYQYGMTRLSNGKVLQCGGRYYTGVGSIHKYSNKCSLYDPSTNTWAYAFNPPELFNVHTSDYQTAETLPSGDAIFCNNYYYTAGKTKCYIYKVATNDFVFTADIPENKAYMHTAMLPDGRLMGCGGWAVGSGALLSSCHAYDSNLDTWSYLTSLPLAGTPVLERLGSGNILVCGLPSTTCYKYNPYSNSWSSVASSPGTLGQLGTSAFGDGRVGFHRASSNAANRRMYVFTE